MCVGGVSMRLTLIALLPFVLVLAWTLLKAMLVPGILRVARMKSAHVSPRLVRRLLQAQSPLSFSMVVPQNEGCCTRADAQVVDEDARRKADEADDETGGVVQKVPSKSVKGVIVSLICSPSRFISVALPSFVFVTFFVVNTVSRAVLAAIGDCAAFYITYSEKQSFLRMDLRIVCGSAQHDVIKSVAWIFFVVW